MRTHTLLHIGIVCAALVASSCNRRDEHRANTYVRAAQHDVRVDARKAELAIESAAHDTAAATNAIGNPTARTQAQVTADIAAARAANQREEHQTQ